jgi:hypothetical protein
MGWTLATSALVFYGLKYDSDFDQSGDNAPMRFVGIFRNVSAA